MSTPRIISMNAYGSGSGKAEIIANVATALALQGNKVCLIDQNIQQPRLHFLFGLSTQLPTYNDFMTGKGELQKLAHNLSSKLEGQATGKLFVIPARQRGVFDTERDDFDIGLFNDALNTLLDELNLDYLLLDTPIGVENETLFALALSDISIFVMRLQTADYQGTSVMIDVAKRLDVPNPLILVNMVDPEFNLGQIKTEVETTYACQVIGVLPQSDTFIDVTNEEGHGGTFVQSHADLAFSDKLRHLARNLAE